ncbi:GGDEF domain-containing protein [Clostridium botulinum]|uniref:GGDEF domain-containing protein n=1 Tax=Clostridium botulinum TaxID=1491 RepID=A0ABD7CFN2_CLOBO|nr:GGDEF domain-containing protein [Clostridium botulinum]KGO12393.1 diguanylate cyclase [Clostridium botulinum]KIN82345.1 diguanylate cyclase [Clostridium botulinum]MCC5428597.1 GGDEF domain-containing protein [Clostridium botulinum]QRI51871.1 GGDEF domain-containing protein [Clostridium botulinum]
MNYNHMSRSELIEELNRKDKIIKRMKYIFGKDPVTSVLNRKLGLEKLHREIKLVKINKGNLIITFADVNNLKYINDNYGHDAGDYVLETLCSIIKNNIGKMDFIFRYGGDEFIIVFLKSNMYDANKILSRIQKEIDELGKDLEYKMGLSYGLVEYSKNTNKTIEDLIKIADYRMYENKREIG